MSWLGRAIGELGSQAGEAHDIALGWRQREQNLLMEKARQKLADLLGPLQLQELQQRIKQMSQPRYEGTVTTPGGGLGAVMLSPSTGQPSLQTLQSGTDRNSVKQRILEMAAKAPTPEYKTNLEQIAKDVDLSQDPLKELERAESISGQAAGKTPRSWSPVRGVGGLFAGVKSPEGIDYFSEETIPDPQGKALFRSLKDTEARYLKHQQEMYLLAKAREKNQDENKLFSQFIAAKKLLAPIERIEDVGGRAKTYVDNPTGPGDVALLSTFVEATKPANGFRWTQQEVNLIRGSRGLVEGAQARVQSGFTGILFENEQRKIIGGILQRASQLAKQKKADLMVQLGKMSPDVAAALQMTAGGEVPEEAPEVPPPPAGYEIEQRP
jgi:hypothetical protein